MISNEPVTIRQRQFIAEMRSRSADVPTSNAGLTNKREASDFISRWFFTAFGRRWTIYGGSQQEATCMLGHRCGRLEVIDRFQVIKKQMHWVCVCDCGELCVVRGSHLRTGNSSSCGCLRRELAAARRLGKPAHNRKRVVHFADPMPYLFKRSPNTTQEKRQ